MSFILLKIHSVLELMASINSILNTIFINYNNLVLLAYYLIGLKSLLIASRALLIYVLNSFFS